MDDSSIAARTEKLRREIELIQQEERNYRNRQAIRLPTEPSMTSGRLESLRSVKNSGRFVEKAKQQSSHGSVWYS